MNLDLSYRYCSKTARSKAKNFYYGFMFLPQKKRMAMSAIYTFMRICDDITDEGSSVDTKKERLNLWKSQVKEYLDHAKGSHPIFPALKDAVESFNIPPELLFEIVEGVAMDLTPGNYQTFEDLYTYCYKVASVVGLVCLHIFGFKNSQALKQAEECGIAFQLTNILRDLKEDAEMGRLYLPLEDLEKFGYPQQNLKNGIQNNAFRKLMEFEASRAEDYYSRCSSLADEIEPDSRKAFKIMKGIYHALLKKIVQLNYDTLSRRVRLTLFEKFKVILSNNA